MAATRTILVTGATGKQGGAVAHHLLGRGWEVRALTRDPSQPAALALARVGAEVVQGDMRDEADVARAVAGTYGVFGVQNTWEHGPESEVQQGTLLAEAAEAAGVAHFVYTSVGGADRNSGIPHFESKWELEEHLRSTGLASTILRPVFFMDNLLSPDNRAAILAGTLSLALHPDTRLQMIAVDDIGGFAAMAFDNPDQWAGRAVELAGDDLTMTECADKLGAVVGRPVAFQELPIEQLRAFSADYATMCEWFISHGYEADVAELRRLYPPLKDLDAWLAGVTWT